MNQKTTRASTPGTSIQISINQHILPPRVFDEALIDLISTFEASPEEYLSPVPEDNTSVLRASELLKSGSYAWLSMLFVQIADLTDLDPNDKLFAVNRSDRIDYELQAENMQLVNELKELAQKIIIERNQAVENLERAIVKETIDKILSGEDKVKELRFVVDGKIFDGDVLSYVNEFMRSREHDLEDYLKAEKEMQKLVDEKNYFVNLMAQRIIEETKAFKKISEKDLLNPNKFEEILIQNNLVVN
jgi:hypothetical protein